MTEYQMMVDAFRIGADTHGNHMGKFCIIDVARFMRCSVREAAKIANDTGDDGCTSVYEAAGFVYEDGWFKPIEGGEG